MCRSCGEQYLCRIRTREPLGSNSSKNNKRQQQVQTVVMSFRPLVLRCQPTHSLRVSHHLREAGWGVGYGFAQTNCIVSYRIVSSVSPSPCLIDLFSQLWLYSVIFRNVSRGTRDDTGTTVGEMAFYFSGQGAPGLGPGVRGRRRWSRRKRRGRDNHGRWGRETRPTEPGTLWGFDLRQCSCVNSKTAAKGIW